MTEGDLPASAGIGRVALTVGDLDEAVAFYRDVVGLAVHSRQESATEGADGGDGAATLGAAERTLLELRADPEAPERPDSAAGLFHTAFRVPSRAALGDALDRVRERWRLTGASDHLVSEALYLRDPEGNGVEVYCDRPRTEWPTTDDGRVAMTTDPLDLDALATESTGAESVPAGSDVGHVHLEVTTLDSARSFYADALGLTVRQSMSGALFLAAGEYHHHVGCNVWDGRSTPTEGRGLAWFDVVVPGEALAAVRERFEAAGVAVEAVPDGAGTGGFAVTDPDGIELRIRPDSE
jgi:catechol 2,3-dioxygenase